MSHFISARCASERCACGKPATHKLAEEIPNDEPCAICDGCFIFRGEPCPSMCHLGIGVVRHALTAYVCCACFTRVLGPATGCPL